jgi:hypothetical protein
MVEGAEVQVILGKMVFMFRREMLPAVLVVHTEGVVAVSQDHQVLRLALEEAVPSVLFGPELRALSHQRTQVTCNGTVYQDKKRTTV